MAEAKVQEQVKMSPAQMERLVEHAAAQSAAEAAAAPAPAKPKAPRQVDAARVAEASFKRTEWVCTAEFGTGPDEIMDEGYFSHVASNLKPYDHIEVRTDDGRWFARLIVLEAGRAWARCFMTEFHNLTEVKIERTLSAPKMRVEWKGPHLQFCVIRISDNQIMKDQLNNEATANAWIRAREQQLAS